MICTDCITPDCRRTRAKGAWRCWFCLRLLRKRHRRAMRRRGKRRLVELTAAIHDLNGQHSAAGRN